MNERLLRRTLTANAGFSLLSAVVMIVAAGPLARLLGPAVPTWLVAAIGLAIVPFAVGVWWAARRTVLRRAEVMVIFAMDLAWVAVSAVLLLALPELLSVTGRWLVGLVALVVADFAVLEYLGMRRRGGAVPA